MYGWVVSKKKRRDRHIDAKTWVVSRLLIFGGGGLPGHLQLRVYYFSLLPIFSSSTPTLSTRLLCFLFRYSCSKKVWRSASDVCPCLTAETNFLLFFYLGLLSVHSFNQRLLHQAAVPRFQRIFFSEPHVSFVFVHVSLMFCLVWSFLLHGGTESFVYIHIYLCMFISFFFLILVWYFYLIPHCIASALHCNLSPPCFVFSIAQKFPRRRRVSRIRRFLHTVRHFHFYFLYI